VLKTFFQYFLIAVIFVLIGWLCNTAYHLPRNSNPIAQVRPTPLLKYTIENLAKADIKPAEIQIGKVLKDDPKFTSYEFTFSFNPNLSGSLKTVSGLINIPKGTGNFPAIVMFRGYVDPTQYFIGTGTSRVAEYFASKGFITVAPDFLGFGDSDREAENVFESRFQTFVTGTTALKSVSSINQFDGKNIFIWGHSNGGQIALTTLEITGVNYPTVLWAPVSKPFPYSILYYTDDASDSGKFLRKELADFENDYDTDLFSLTKYLSSIKAPLQLNQGTADDAVPVAWSNLLAKELKESTISAEYIKYPGANHNLTPGWNQAVANALIFYQKHLK
jgi:dipeptidyl aminopeptidase/acylaminoacyl peptidase